MSRTKTLTPLLAALAAASMAACGGGEAGVCNGSELGGGILEGSYCSDLELRWTEVRTELRSGRTFLLEYIRPAGTGTEKALSLDFDITAVVPDVDARIQFLGASGQVRQVLSLEGEASSRTITNDLDPTMSTLTFTAPFSSEIGAQVEGEFALFFTATGRILSGRFNSTLIDRSQGGE